MFWNLIRKEETPIDKEIARVLEVMRSMSVNHDEYSKHLTYLERLNEVKEKNSGSPLSRDTMATVIGNLLGILLIVGYERHNVLVSKGMNHIIRPR